MKTIFETFKKSIYNPAFYREVSEESFSNASTYYFKATFVFSVFLTVALTILLVPQGVIFVKEKAPSLVQTYYPKELTVNIEKGIASANVEMPYLVPIKNIPSIATTTIKNMLVVDTTKEFSRTKFEEYSTYALLTRTDIVTRGDNGAITIQPLGRALTMTISQDVLLSLVAKVQNSLPWIVIVGIMITMLLLFLGYVMYLIPLLLFAFIPKLIAYVKKDTLSYGSAYKMSLYAIVPALAFKTLLNAVGVLFLPSFFTFLVFLLIIVINMRNIERPTLFETSN